MREREGEEAGRREVRALEQVRRAGTCRWDCVGVWDGMGGQAVQQGNEVRPCEE